MSLDDYFIESCLDDDLTESCLDDDLKDFCERKVYIAGEEMRRAKKLVMDYTNLIKDGLQSDEAYNNLLFEIGDPLPCGSVWEGVRAEKANEFDVDFPIILNSFSWDSQKLNDYSADHGKYKCVLKNGHNFYKELSILQKYGTNPEYDRSINPMLVKNAFEEEVKSTLEELHNPCSRSMWKIKKRSEGSPAVTLLIYDVLSPNEHISLDIVPVLNILKCNNDNVCLVPKGKSGYWRRSFAQQEKNLMNTIDLRDRGCRRQVLRIVKTIASQKRIPKNPLSKLDSYTLKNALFNFHENGEWRTDDLGDYFVRFINYLEECLDVEELPRFFEPKHNLLSCHSRTALDEIATFLKDIRITDNYESLL